MPSLAMSSLTSNTDTSETPKQGSLNGSDFQDLFDTYKNPPISKNYYWLGKRIFEQMLAEKIFRDSAVAQNSDDLDESLVQAIFQYPYREQLEHIQPTSSFKACFLETEKHVNYFRAFVTGLAAAFLQSNTEGRLRLASIVQGGVQGRHRPIPPGPVMQSYSTPAGANRQSTNSASISDGNTPMERARYTTALKEYGDQSGADVRWVDRQVSVAPLCWQVSAMADDQMFRATASSKRDARHRASQMACEALGIDI
ncbi:uncharacterized protein RHO25_011592 [Cercospora beticola]|nr:hypothetical protein RHO25_011592 [Cercospora beticola]